MRPLWIWSRSGPALPLGLVVLGAVGSTVVLDPDWHLEADWGLRLTAATVSFISPLVAAAVAFDTVRRHRPAVADFALASPRRVLPSVMPVVSLSVTVTLAYLLVWAGVLATAAASGGIGPTDWWVFPETLGPVIAAAFVGRAVGEWIHGIGAPIVAAVAVLAAAVVVSPWGRGPFEAVTTYGTLTGLERPPGQAAAVVAVTVVTAAMGAVAAARSRDWFRRPLRRALLVAALVPVWVLPAAWPWPDQVYRTSTEPVECTGTVPALCGPRSRVPLLAMAQPAFARAYERLQGTEFVRPSHFTVTRLGRYSDLDGAAPLDFDPAALTGRGYPPGSVVAALLRPHECAELFDAAEAVPVLEAQGRVEPWLLNVVEGRRPARPEPPEVSSSFDVILDCRVYTGNWG